MRIVKTKLECGLSLLKGYNRLTRRTRRLPERMMLVLGLSGTAKTSECSSLAKEKNEIFLTISANETPSSLLAKLCVEVGIVPHYRTAQMELALIERLGSLEKAIFVDEADFLFHSRHRVLMAESLRVIHDLACVPVIFIGQPVLEGQIARYPHLDRRVIQRVRFGTLSLEDANRLVDELCEVVLDRQVVAQVLFKYPTIGSFLNEIERIESIAKLQRWGNLSFSSYSSLVQVME